MNTAFSTSTPTLQLAWDSTSLGTFKLCPRKYQLFMVYSLDGALIGWAERFESVHLTFGQLYHGALERYDHARCAGLDHEDSVDVCLDWTLKATWDKERQRPWNSDSKYKNRFTLVRAVVWYLEHFKNDPLKTITLANGKPAVELSFRFSTTYSSREGEPFLLCGHLDRLALLNEDPYVVDRKTTQTTITPQFFTKYSPDNQFSVYTFATKIAFTTPVKGLIVDAAQMAVTFSRFERGFVTRSDDQLEEWYVDLGHWLALAEHYAKQNYWPMNDRACGDYGGCPFRGICSKPPSVRETWLKAEFTQRTWDPLIVRGDI